MFRHISHKNVKENNSTKQIHSFWTAEVSTSGLTAQVPVNGSV